MENDSLGCRRTLLGAKVVELSPRRGVTVCGKLNLFAVNRGKISSLKLLIFLDFLAQRGSARSPGPDGIEVIHWGTSLVKVHIMRVKETPRI